MVCATLLPYLSLAWWGGGIDKEREGGRKEGKKEGRKEGKEGRKEGR